MHDDSQKLVSYHNLLFVFPICRRKGLKFLDDLKKKRANAPLVAKDSPWLNKTGKSFNSTTWNFQTSEPSKTSKGQLISKANSLVLISTKYRTKLFFNFCTSL